MPDLAAFHFLRPWWLLGLIGAAALYVAIRMAYDADRQWRGVIEPHLLAHLLVIGGRRTWFRPQHLTSLVLVIGSVALAGPAWERELPPFTEDTAPLVIALDLSRGMDAVDVPPTRLERATQKIRDLLVLRRGARTALVVYAGTAHTVMPLTDDPSVLEPYLLALETSIMPVPGKAPVPALELAGSLLARDTVPGTILFVTDGVAAEHAPAFASHAEQTRDRIMVLAVGTAEGGPIRTGDGRYLTQGGRRTIATLDREGLEALSREAGVSVTSITVDTRDVERIQRGAQQHLRDVRAAEADGRWKDAGYFLAFPVLVLTLLWFRRGWTVQWER